MEFTNYGAKDLTLTITHPAMEPLHAYGEGLVSVAFALAEDSSAHDVAMDGSVMTSQIEAQNGLVTITAQQTSAIHKWFTKLYNYLRGAPLNQHTAMSLIAKGSDMRVTHTAEHVSIQKRPDKTYEAQGAHVTWVLMAGLLVEK